MGEVYRANDLKLKQPVALKFLPETASRDPRLLARFHGEVRLAHHCSQRIDHFGGGRSHTQPIAVSVSGRRGGSPDGGVACDRIVKVLSMKEPPSRTSAFLLGTYTRFLASSSPALNGFDGRRPKLAIHGTQVPDRTLKRKRRGESSDFRGKSTISGSPRSGFQQRFRENCSLTSKIAI
jgi:hypothetical protein